MAQKILVTGDNSHSLMNEEIQETYHSIHGAIEESTHVFLKSGLHLIQEKNISIFELGFGTGLNALITLLEAKKLQLNIQYHSIEKFPVEHYLIKQLNYGSFFNDGDFWFDMIHHCKWNIASQCSSMFELLKIQNDFMQYEPNQLYHLIYFDAFSPDKAPELWSIECFKKTFNMLMPGGILVTYCAKGIVRRNMEAAGYKVERIPGAPPKKEMLRASKI